jgi:hypothetical protein
MCHRHRHLRRRPHHRRCPPRHRILPSYEATAEGWDGERLVQALLELVPLP